MVLDRRDRMHLASRTAALFTAIAFVRVCLLAWKDEEGGEQEGDYQEKKIREKDIYIYLLFFVFSLP